MSSRFVLSLAFWVTGSLCVNAQDTAAFSPEKAAFFQDEVVPVLKANCLKCHAGTEPKGGLNLTSRESILKGGDSGPAVDRANPADSILLHAINYDGYEMPPTGQMSPKHIGILTKWVEQKLPWPQDLHEIEFEVESGPPAVNDANKQFWAYQPVQDRAVPNVANPGTNAIDAFVRSRLQKAGLSASPPAAAQELVRRMHYDLLGLPPEPSTVKIWSDRISPADGTLNQEAISDFIELLLESPHYGEHWGRHWLDLVRYAETNSYERDDAKPHVWRYRDYVIRSFNDDKPYDQFIREQLAGDELEDSGPDAIIATGYYRLGRWDDEPADPLLAWYDDVDDIITTTSQTFLAMTVNCARCHDHKIDPIPQSDYYRMVAFFRNVRRYGVRSGESVLEASVANIDRPEDAQVYQQQVKRYENDLRDATQHVQRIEKLIWDDLQEVEKEELKFDMNRVPIVAKRQGTVLNEKQVNTYRHQFARLQNLKANKPQGLGAALCVKEDVRQLTPTHVLLRGNPHAQGDPVTPGFPAILSPPEVTIPDPDPSATSSGRRLVLANWIASPANPLTARVMVNRIWQYHFGRGLVRSSSDFGFQGTPPTHPELLDWLAARFVESGWSIKAMHRLIMSSATYQMSSRPNDKSFDVDPTNDLFWRFDMRRLSAEEIRDSILWATGSLNPDKMYGPSIFTDIPDAVKAGQSRPGSGWGHSPPEDANRRSIYIHVKRSLLDPLLESFDMADTDQTCPVRFVTVQPTQALGLMNSEFLQKQSQAFAEFLKREHATAEARVTAALNRTLQRHPSSAEVKQGLDLMRSLKNEHEMTEDQALKYFCLVALNLNEFMYLD